MSSGRKGTPRRRKGGHHHHHHPPPDHAANPGPARDAGGRLGPGTPNRTILIVVVVILVAGLVAFGALWAVAWG